MSTASKTSLSNGASAKRKRGGGLTLGCARCKKQPRIPGEPTPFRDIPFDVLDKILAYMATSHSPLSVIKLSMVNRSFRQGVNENLHVWYQLYRYWRGPIHPQDRMVKTAKGTVRLLPSVPTSLPNFMVKEPPKT